VTLAAKDTQERERRILQAAGQVLRDRGFSGTRLADVAAAADTSPSLVLYHFPSLTELLVAALKAEEDRFFDQLRTLSADADPRGQLVTMVTMVAEGGSAFGDWQLWLEIWVRGRHDKRVRDLQRLAEQRWREQLRAVIDEGQSRGVFVSADPDDAVVRLSSLLDGLAIQLVVGGAGLDPAELVRIWLGGAAHELQVDEEFLIARVGH
jgi:AcrR family transcriptional regulator